MAIYIVHTKSFGDLRKAANSIHEARNWARKAFPREPTRVMREYRHCDLCDSSPCACANPR